MLKRLKLGLDIDLIVAFGLRWGVAVGGMTLLLSMLMMAIDHPLGEVWGVRALWLLVMLPIFRVFVTGLLFFFRRDYFLFVITLGVLTLLGLSFMQGAAHG